MVFDTNKRKNTKHIKKTNCIKAILFIALLHHITKFDLVEKFVFQMYDSIEFNVLCSFNTSMVGSFVRCIVSNLQWLLPNPFLAKEALSVLCVFIVHTIRKCFVCTVHTDTHTPFYLQKYFSCFALNFCFGIPEFVHTHTHKKNGIIFLANNMQN